ncbi:EamA family transporter [Candidatus Aerophobetes bacterium]|nr:EamA family transporter [Candidatus Aerophobetes bacterium]
MKPEVLVIISVLLGVAGQILLKKGMSLIGPLDVGLSSFIPTLILIFREPFVLSGIFSYAISTIFWLFALSKVQLSYAYPMISIGYILVLLFSWLFLGEKISLVRVFGVLLICMGVFMVLKS